MTETKNGDSMSNPDLNLINSEYAKNRVQRPNQPGLSC